MNQDASTLEVLPHDIVAVRRFKTTAWRAYPTVTLDHFVNPPARDVPLSPYGGRADQPQEATGFFRTQQLDGVWTFIDPGGSPFVCIGTNPVTPDDQEPDTRYAFADKFTNPREWAEWVSGLLKDLGINTLGAGSDHDAFASIGKPVPYTPAMSVVGDFARKLGLYERSYGSTDMKNQVLPIFHEDFPAHVDRCFHRLSVHREDPWLLGVFSDNEIPLYERKILSRYLGMGEDDPGCRHARAWMKQRGLAEADIGPDHGPDHDRDFCEHVLSTYFAMVRQAMDTHLPNHLYLGTRFHKAINSQLSAYKALGPYADVISMNLYHRWTPDQQALTEWSRAAGKPLMITEWYAKGEDSGLRNLAGAGMTVRTQAERAKFYENFTLHLLRHPSVVGWNWFRWMDEAALRHGENSTNKGVLNWHYEPYAELTAAMRRINRRVYTLRDALLGFSHANLPDSSPVIQDPELDEVETELTGEHVELF